MRRGALLGLGLNPGASARHGCHEGGGGVAAARQRVRRGRGRSLQLLLGGLQCTADEQRALDQLAAADPGGGRWRRREERGTGLNRGRA